MNKAKLEYTTKGLKIILFSRPPVGGYIGAILLGLILIFFTVVPVFFWFFQGFQFVIFIIIAFDIFLWVRFGKLILWNISGKEVFLLTFEGLEVQTFYGSFKAKPIVLEGDRFEVRYVPLNPRKVESDGKLVFEYPGGSYTSLLILSGTAFRAFCEEVDLFVGKDDVHLKVHRLPPELKAAE